MKVSARVLCAWVACGVFAAGLSAQDFYWGAASARSQAFGGAYVPSSMSALDPLAVNPAGLAMVNAPTVDVSVAAGFARGSFSNAVNHNSPMKTPVGVMPYGAFATPIAGTRFSVGAGLIPELMSNSEWNYADAPGALGASYGQQRHRAAILAARAVAGGSFRLHSRLSVGASVGFVYNENRLQAPYIFQEHPALAGLKTMLDLRTSGVGRNYSIGVIAVPSNKVTIGVAWKSRTVIESTGRATGDIGVQLAAAGLGGARPDFAYDAAVRNVLPQSVIAHILWRANPRWMFGFQSGWLNWKDSFQKLPVALTNGNNADINGVLGTNAINDGVPLDWKDQFSFRGGFERSLTERASIRGGYAHMNNPVPAATLSPLTAAIQKDQLTAGFGYAMGKARLDLAYGFGFQNRASVGQSGLKSGEYSNSRVSLGTQMLTLNTSFQF